MSRPAETLTITDPDNTKSSLLEILDSDKNREDIANCERIGRDQIHFARRVDIKTRYIKQPKVNRSQNRIGQSRFLETAPDKSPLLFCYDPSKKPIRQSLIQTSGTKPAISIRKKVKITENIKIYDFDCSAFSYLLLLHTREDQSATWLFISKYAPVLFMVMSDLKIKFGKDSANPDGWLKHVERFSPVEDILIDVKDTYQKLHNEESRERQEIIDQKNKSQPAPPWLNSFKLF